MTSHDARAFVGIDVGTQASPDAQELTDAAFRVLIIGDFGGAAVERVPLAQRAVHRIDRDGIDAAMAHIAPAVAFSIEPGAAPERIDFRELDDFHPDRLLTLSPMLARLRALRTTAESQPLHAPGSPAAAAPKSPEQDTRGLLDRILDSEPPLPATREPSTAGTGGDDLAEFVRRAVRPHVAKEVDPQQRALVAQVDDVIAATLRVLLHDPGFQALESLWRATDFFLRRCDAGESTSIGLLDLTARELAALDSGGGDGGALQARLSSGDEGAPWSLVVAAFHFGPQDVGLLTSIARLAESMGVPWLGAAQPQLAGASTFADNGDADEWDSSPAEGWDALRGQPAARFLGLSLPRFLLRLPYGKDNPVESVSFVELSPGARMHESFLWGNPAFLCGLVAAAPVDRGAPATTHGAVGGLPLHIEDVDGVAEALPCAEVLLSQRTVMQVLARGLTPLAAERNGDTIRIPRLQSIAAPPAPLAVRPPLRS